MKIIIATGGTGGHIFTGLAIASELEIYGAEIVIVGSKFGMEQKIIKNKYPIRFTYQKPLIGRDIKDKLLFPIFLKLSLLQSLYLLIKEHPNAVIGTGGFGSFSVVFVASLLGIPTLITEIDSLPGLTTRILSYFVFEIWLAFENAKYKLPNKKMKIAGFPVRKEITQVNKSLQDFGLKENKPTIFVFGGSRGATRINEVIKETISLVPEYQFIWQTGESMEPISTPNLWRTKFIDDMGSVYGNVDLIISRAGALTIGELIEVGVPSILIPYPYSAGGHQVLNARILEKKGAVKVILEKDLTPKLLATEIKKIINNKELQKKMKLTIKKFSPTNAAKKIAKRIIKICSDI
jgi:UDP-N-acetylglucosamine--N-acetylmuramyl-(pentapeptide) pyrophosphoryl-undecaprenol N-acetylglucosamine transferase